MEVQVGKSTTGVKKTKEGGKDSQGKLVLKGRLISRSLGVKREKRRGIYGLFHVEARVHGRVLLF